MGIRHDLKTSKKNTLKFICVYYNNYSVNIMHIHQSAFNLLIIYFNWVF